MTPTVAFETKCYERDWKIVANERYLRTVISKCQHSFDHRVLYLNNFSDFGPVIQAAKQLVKADVIDEYCIVEDYATSALRALDITRASLSAGYHYSIAELVGIYRCKTDYLLHFSGDSQMETGAPNWIGSAIQIMEQRTEVLVANPVPSQQYEAAQGDAIAEDDDWYYSAGHFSDQCYLVRVEAMQRKGIYNERHVISERYPAYGGELFEKRVDAYMRNHGLQRITSKHASYIHQNHFPVGRREWLRRQGLQKIHHLSVLAKLIATGRWGDGARDVAEVGKRLYERGRRGRP